MNALTGRLLTAPNHESLSKEELMEALGLGPHREEGGYYTERYRSERWRMSSGAIAMDTIYYMLTDDSPIGHFHRNKSDIVHFHHLGGSIRYTTIDDCGTVETFVLGKDVAHGEQLQCMVAGGLWKASELISGEFGLISEAVVPAFNPADRVVTTRALLRRLYPALDQGLLRLAWDEHRTDEAFA